MNLEVMTDLREGHVSGLQQKANSSWKIRVTSNGTVADYTVEEFNEHCFLNREDAEKYITNFLDYTPDAISRQLLIQFKQELYTNENNEDVETYKKVCDKTLELTCKNLVNYFKNYKYTNLKLSV